MSRVIVSNYAHCDTSRFTPNKKVEIIYALTVDLLRCEKLFQREQSSNWARLAHNLIRLVTHLHLQDFWRNTSRWSLDRCARVEFQRRLRFPTGKRDRWRMDHLKESRRNFSASQQRKLNYCDVWEIKYVSHSRNLWTVEKIHTK